MKMLFSLSLSSTDIFLWISQLCYFACLLPQIRTNFREKSGVGVSQLMLLGYLNGYLFLLYYVFCNNLPLAYRFFAPIQTLATAILVFQRLYYNEPLRIWLLYGLNIIVFISLMPLALKSPISFGGVCGWLAISHGALNQLPQVFKLFSQQSVLGFSFFFVLLTGGAASAEMIGSLIGGLPMQCWLNGLRGVIIFLIFCYQFSLYRK